MHASKAWWSLAECIFYFCDVSFNKFVFCQFFRVPDTEQVTEEDVCFFSSLIVGDFDLVTSTQYNHFLFKHSHLLLKCKYNVYNRVWDAGWISVDKHWKENKIARQLKLKSNHYICSIIQKPWLVLSMKNIFCKENKIIMFFGTKSANIRWFSQKDKTVVKMASP